MLFALILAPDYQLFISKYKKLWLGRKYKFNFLFLKPVIMS